VSEGQLDSADELRQSVDALESSATTTLTSGSRGALLCHVRLLNGEQFTTRVEKKAVGQVLFDSVCKYLNIIERDYFACSYRDVGSVRMWLRNDKRIMDQLTDDTALLFQFEVKFYPPDIATLQEDITRYQFCLQIQNDIGSGCLPCSFLTYALLGSYLAQSVLGDYDTVELGTGFDYLRRMTFAPNQTDELLEKVAELHCNHRGLVPADAETEYLINASRLALYGVDVHHVLDYIGDSASVGVCSSGLMIYRDRLRIRRLPWVSIIQVSYKRCNFCVSVRPAEHSELSASGSGSDASYVIKFKMASKLLAKRLWRSTVEHHMFFRLKESVAVNNGILSRFLGSQFRFSGRTQQQVKRDAMVVSRRPQLAMSHQHGTTALHHAAVDGIVARSLSCDVDSDTNRCSSDQPTFCSEPCTFSADCQQTIDLYSTRSSQPVAVDNQSCLPPLATVTIPATTTVVAEILHVDTSPVAMTTTRHCAARFSPVPSATSSGTAVSMSSRQATPSRCSSDLTSSTVRTLNRLITVKTANGNSSLISDRPNDAITDFGMLISARSHTSRTHTVETTMYQTERDGVMVEKKLLINTEGAADPDKMLAAAIESVTAMGDELTVEKVEIHTVAELELD
jgi:erythrocyte membrane protein band 4.1